jgi:sugar transferase (PEP-CTERM system associated)
LSIFVFGISQFLWHALYKFCLNLPGIAKRVLILGSGPLAKKIGALIHAKSRFYTLAGYVSCTDGTSDVPASFIIGSCDELVQTAKNAGVDHIIVSLSEHRGVMPMRGMLACKLSGIEVTDAVSFYEEMTGKLLIENIRPSSLIYCEGFHVTPVNLFMKRVSDILFATAGLILALPLIPLIALLIKLDSRGPVFYKQVRVGQGERKFLLYKFRTMVQDSEADTGAVWARENDPRITRVGAFLRKSRLDEIPQLLNVLRGDISLIGPRPERPEFVEELKKIIPYYSERHIIKPGLTGWAQVRYPYGASVEDAIEKLKYDLYYHKNLSFVLDMTIILDTIKVVLIREGGR